MRTAKRVAIVAVAAGLLASGCSRGVKEVIGKPKGIYAPLTPVAADKDARPLGRYTHFELGDIDDAFGGKVPPELFRFLPEKFAEQLQEHGLPDVSGGKTLLIRGKVYHYETQGLVGHIFGPLEEVVARMQLVDKDNGWVVGVANCVGRTNETRNRGAEKKAEGLAKAIVLWIKDNYPEIEQED
ncbi:MAG: hypothetical protein ACYTF6_10410 [Planctomycetota bacterium]|jgi:hypothetical protein